MSTWSCANCERQSGHLEKAYEYDSRIVCQACYKVLSARAPASPGGVPLAEAADTKVVPWFRPGYTSHARLAALTAVLILVCLMAHGASLGWLIDRYGNASHVTYMGLYVVYCETYLIVCPLLVLLFLPWFIAWHRYHPNARAIFLLCLFLGGTFIGWVLTLVWSVMALPKVSAASASKA